jgi:prepilin-type N-terminal cleavage/methylation domain-containing protein/prepilin-type processing-associated H-X9-DG protein
MKIIHIKRADLAFTLFELLLVLAIIAVVAVVLLKPPSRSTRAYAYSIACRNELKSVALAFRVWSGDNNDKLPMEVSVTNGGTMEFVNGADTFRHFEVMSNEINTPKILFCPAESDKFRERAEVFGPAHANRNSPRVRFLSNTNLSYFVGLHATITNSSMFLIGDHNLENGVVVKTGVYDFTTNQPPGWTPGVHNRRGNVALVDGSVHSLSSGGLPGALAQTGVATNRLSMP